MIHRQFEAVKENMKSMVKYSKSEYNKYKSTRNIIYLQQAGEKLFNAIENYIQFINKLMVGSFYEIKSLVKEQPLRKLLYDAQDLHRFFYRGELEMNIIDAENLYKSILIKFEQRIERL